MDAIGSGLQSLLVIVVIAYVAPYVASLIPGKPIPEAVFLVFAGALLGPHGLPLIDSSLDSIDLLSQLGCAFLFLMAGYEIDVKQVAGPMGKHASLTWVFSLVIALVIVPFLPLGDTDQLGRWAFALAMTTTAYGTLAPIMRDRGLDGTPVGKAVTVYGATGEVLPVLAMGILLSTRGTWLSIASIGVYLLVCLAVLWRTKRMKSSGSGVTRFIGANQGTGAQATVRASVLLLVFLVAMANDLHLDIVVGAFAAGFILRALIPQGNLLLESKLEALSFGFFVPLFFVVSGTSIDLAAVGENPLLFVGFIVLLLLVRAVPVYISLRTCSESRGLTFSEKFSAAMYCMMALPVIVAVTSVAVNAGAMTENMASVLVTGGAFTVIAVPVITALTRTVESIHPVAAVQEVAAGQGSASVVWHRHLVERRHAEAGFHEARQVANAEGHHLSSADYLAMGNSAISSAFAEGNTLTQPAAASESYQKTFVNQRRIGFMRFIQVVLLLQVAFGVLVAYVAVSDPGSASAIDAAGVLALVAHGACFVLIVLRKQIARRSIIVLLLLCIATSVLANMACGVFSIEGQLLQSLPDLLMVIYFATSHRVRAQLVRP